MNEQERPRTADDKPSEPQSSSEAVAEDGERGESWLSRLAAAVGLKNGATFREDLEEALSRPEATESFTPEERAMLKNILRLREVRVKDVMVPRADIEAVELGVTLGGLFEAFRESGHSRMPVYRETLDDPLGMVHIKDLMNYVARVAAVPSPADGQTALDLRAVDLSKRLTELDLVRNVLFVPPSMTAATLLATMQASRMQMALVIDEYGGTDGLVSLEDVVEAVVGDIEDEHDLEEAPTIAAEADGVFIADARADLDEVREAIGADFALTEAEEDVDTVGGLVFTLLGRIPVRGELVSVPGGFEIEILDADPRRVKRLRIRRRPVGEAKRKPRPASEAKTG